MPYKNYRQCPLCQLSVKDISSHLRLKHCLSSIQRKPYLENAHVTSISNGLVPVIQPEEFMLRQIKSKANDTYLTGNLKLLRRFFAMTRERKKWYLKKHAPQSFVLFLREALNMIEVGRIKCGEKLDDFYKDKILNRDVSNDKARLLISKDNVIDFVECMTVEVMAFLSEKLE